MHSADKMSELGRFPKLSLDTLNGDSKSVNLNQGSSSHLQIVNGLNVQLQMQVKE